MLTGDNRTTAEIVGHQLGIEEIEAEVSPARKGEALKQLQAQGRIVAMAGDGINDAPALAQADVGIAMGSGTDIAIQSSGITLVKGDLRGVVRARKLSRHTMRNIRQNLFFAFVYNILGVPIAAGVLYPVNPDLLLNPMIASAAMTFSSCRSLQTPSGCATSSCSMVRERDGVRYSAGVRQTYMLCATSGSSAISVSSHCTT